MTLRTRILRPVPRSTVWAVLRLYVAVGAGAGSYLGRLGLGKGRPEVLGTEYRATIGAKLRDCPTVERVLWCQLAVDWLRRVAQPAELRGNDPSIDGMPPQVFAALADVVGYGFVGVTASDAVDTIERQIVRLIRRRSPRDWPLYDMEMLYLGCALAACDDEWPGFCRVAIANERET